MSNDVTIWHNPGCGTSRNTLAMIRAAGIESTVIDEYLRNPPSREKLIQFAAAGLAPRALLREKGTPFAELGLAYLTDRYSERRAAGRKANEGKRSARREVRSDSGGGACSACDGAAKPRPAQ